jgi:lysophospholipase L1-like esterase
VHLVTAMLLALLLAIPTTVAASAPKDERVYLALGDSLALGSGATRPDQVGYVPHLAGFFRGAAHGGTTSTLTVALRGATSESFISSGRLAQAVAAIDAGSDVVVVTLDIGGNDLLGLVAPGQPCAIDLATLACQMATAEALRGFVANYSTILGELTAALVRDPGEEQLLVATFYNPLSGTGSPLEAALDRALLGSDGKVDCGGNPAQHGLNDLISCIAVQYSVSVADVYPLFVGKATSLTHIQGGDVHPTNAGYAAIATAFRRAAKTGD